MGFILEDDTLEGGERFEVNSHSLMFIKKEDLKWDGYPEFIPKFEASQNKEWISCKYNWLFI